MKKRNKVLVTLVEHLLSTISSDDYLERSREREKDFTRRRKMSFAHYVWFLLTSIKRSLAVGLNEFRNKMDAEWETYSKQAFSQGRRRIKPEAVRELVEATRDRFYEEAEYKTWRGKRVLAIDGSKYNLPFSEELREHYGIQKSSGEQVQALGSFLYDVMNSIVLDARLTRVDGNERKLAVEHLKELESCPTRCEKGELILFDRGYPSYDMIQEIQKRGFYYAMRCSKDFCRKIKVPESNDCVIDHRFVKARETTKLRVVRFKLEDSNEEIIISNLFDKDLSLEDFKELYHYRWGIETSYNNVKNKLEIENFSGQSVKAVLQDYYATVTIANLVAAMIYDNQKQIEEYNRTSDNKYQYKQNVNTSIGIMRNELLGLLTEDSPARRKKRMLRLMRYAYRSLVPVRPGRSFPRRVAHPGAAFPVNARK